jgi:hypothetical protein
MKNCGYEMLENFAIKRTAKLAALGCYGTYFARFDETRQVFLHFQEAKTWRSLTPNSFFRALENLSP